MNKHNRYLKAAAAAGTITALEALVTVKWGGEPFAEALVQAGLKSALPGVLATLADQYIHERHINLIGKTETQYWLTAGEAVLGTLLCNQRPGEHFSDALEHLYELNLGNPSICAKTYALGAWAQSWAEKYFLDPVVDETLHIAGHTLHVEVPA